MTKPATPLSSEKTYNLLESPDKFNPVIQELREYLKTKLQFIEVIGGDSYFSCGHDYHYKSDCGWIPFKHLDAFCIETGYDFYALRDLIEEQMGRKLICDCAILNDPGQMRRDRLRRVFGIEIDGRDAGFVVDSEGKGNEVF